MIIQREHEKTSDEYKFEWKNLQARFWVENFTTCQILNQKLYNVAVLESNSFFRKSDFQETIDFKKSCFDSFYSAKKSDINNFCSLNNSELYFIWKKNSSFDKTEFSLRVSFWIGNFTTCHIFLLKFYNKSYFEPTFWEHPGFWITFCTMRLISNPVLWPLINLPPKFWNRLHFGNILRYGMGLVGWLIELGQSSGLATEISVIGQFKTCNTVRVCSFFFLDENGV